MSSTIFDYTEFHRLIEQFCADLPQLFARHRSTADLVPQVANLLDVAETPFTVAIVGQMRVGKSSLLNALVGGNHAVTGVNETTATINWFKYGEPAECDRFRVVWKDRPAEYFPRSEIIHWVGDSQRAEATRYIEFFANAEFLRHANVVDTPGMRSVIQSHEDTTQEFLALRREKETQREGNASDAIVYVLMPVARQTDQDLLADFESGTRLPGSSPYNSMAVVHKWETLEADDPFSEAQRKADRIATAMSGLISKVLPVSAPLAMAAERFEDSFWAQILDLTSNAASSVLEELLLTERYFSEKNIAGCSLDHHARKQLRAQFPLPWPSLKHILKLAQVNRPGQGSDLRTAVLQRSGIIALRDELERTFFSRTKVIKTFSILSKAWEPCQIANARLRNHKLQLSRLLEQSQQSIGYLSSQIVRGDANLLPVQNYIEATQKLAEDDLRVSGESLRVIGEKQLHIKDSYDDINDDFKMLELIEQNASTLDHSLMSRLQCLFGYRGPDVVARTASWRSQNQSLITVDDIERGIGELRRLRASAKTEVRQLFDHAQKRLEQIADWLENNTTV